MSEPPSLPPADRPCLTDWSTDEYRALAELPGARPFHAKSVRRWVLERGARSVDEMTDLSKALRREIADRVDVRRTRVALRSDSEDGTVKLLFTLRDDRTIESVLIPEGERWTLCMSTQVGCGVRCVFCASGALGVVRSLTSGEMVEQFLESRRALSEAGFQLTNVVLMGGGEPLNNFDNVKRALAVLNADDGAGFGARRFTLSTIGIPSKIDRLEELGKQVNLAVSLHAPNEALRGALIPGLDRVPLDDVLAATRRYFERTGREITFEYVVLRDLNDTRECAEELVGLLRGARCKVNLIPFNPVEGKPYRRPAKAAVDAMRDVLLAAGIKTTVRRSRGRDIDAACGQLRRRFPTGAALEKHGTDDAAPISG